MGSQWVMAALVEGAVDPGLMALAVLGLMALAGALYGAWTSRAASQAAVEEVAAPPPAAPAARSFGDYQVEEVLWESPYSITYRGFSPAQEQPVVVKVMKPPLADREAWRQRFLRTVRQAGQLQTDLVAPLVGWGERRDMLYVVHEHLEGLPLHPSRERPPQELLRPFPAFFRELDGLHRRSLVHGNLKPSKIRLDSSGRARLTDFGPMAGSGCEGRCLGTPAYLAPEQLQGETVDARADQYSLGAILFELLSGELPFSGPNATGLMLRKQVEQAPPLRARRPDLPEALEKWMAKVLAPEPSGRFADLSEAATALEQCLSPAAESGG